MKHKTLGSVGIVAGTALGAGMLAMPIATAGVGFGTTVLLLLGLWAVMSYTALLMVEVYQHHSPHKGLSALAYYYLGRPGQWAANLAMPFLLYALIAAYLVGGGHIVNIFLQQLGLAQAPEYLGIVLFTLIGGGVVVVGTHSVDLVNRVLFATKILFLLLMLSLLLPFVRGELLLATPVQQALVLAAIPIIFTSFGFHGSIPSIVSYMQGDVAKLKRVFVLGSAIPLAVYLLWQLATLGVVESHVFLAVLAESAGISGLLTALKAVTPQVEVAVRAFAGLALATSFLGVSLGLFDFMAQVFRHGNHSRGRLRTGLITFLPPLAFALYFPQGFVFALGFAAVALSVLSLLLPALLAWRVRQRHSQQHYRVWGGSAALALVLVVGVGIIAIQLAVVVGALPDVG